MLRNVHPNMVMVVLRDLIQTPLYKYLNVTIHHQWTCLFILYMNSKFQIPTYKNASSDNSDIGNEKIHYTLIVSMIHNFLNEKKNRLSKHYILCYPKSKFSPFKFI